MKLDHLEVSELEAKIIELEKGLQQSLDEVESSTLAVKLFKENIEAYKAELEGRKTVKETPDKYEYWFYETTFTNPYRVVKSVYKFLPMPVANRGQLVIQDMESRCSFYAGLQTCKGVIISKEQYDVLKMYL